MQKFALASLILTLFMAGTPALAQENPPTQAQIAYSDMTDTHPPLRLTPDRSEFIHLSAPAKSIIVGNPNHLSVSIESPDMLVMAPLMPGATYFTVLGENGRVLMQRHVVVGAAKEKYIRVRNKCIAAEEGCQPEKIYYCPDACHEISMTPPEGARSAGGGGDPFAGMMDIFSAAAAEGMADSMGNMNLNTEGAE